MAATNSGKFRPDRSDQVPRKEPVNQILGDSTPDVRIRELIANDAVDVKYGFKRDKEPAKRTGFLINMHSNEMQDPEDKKLLACVDYYFIEENGKRFKISLPFRPYFYILVTKEFVPEVAGFMIHNYSGIVLNAQSIYKEDLDMPNHLIGLKQLYIKLEFRSVSEMQRVRRDILAYVRKNKEREQSNTFYTEMLTKSLLQKGGGDVGTVERIVESTDHIIDIREYDVPYHVRVSIDRKIFCGLWYDVKSFGLDLKPAAEITIREDLIERPDPIVLAFDIETTKLPLKFPDAATDQVMMISYMIDGKGFLITNREIISDDIDSFEYTPKPEFEGLFKVYNEKDEKALILRFFSHIQKVKPHIFVTYNGDFFDWPFIETRAAVYSLDMKAMIGFEKGADGIYSCRPCIHMDCLCWVKRDSYLPVGSQNLKAVAKAKLRYDPVELDPEDMCKMAEEKPAILANYSVSDAVATYYLYMKYVHPFIFALCTIIPAEPDEVLRKGSGTLCECLLMVEAFHANIIFPNRQVADFTQFTDDGHVLHTETYVGGHVEALESGVFRADLPCRFRMIPAALDRLIDDVDRTLRHAIEAEEKIPLEYVTNLDEIKAAIVEQLTTLRDHPNRVENPIIYHLDVGAMYPNIILTNRLQPSAMVDESVCASCDFNQPDAVCKRDMNWMWRAEYMPASRNEYQRIRQQLETERFPPKYPNGKPRAFHQLTKEEMAEYEKKRLQEYCRKAYKKVRVTTVKERNTTICMKENSFYVDTVRAFRDRRYEYKALNKKAKQAVNKAVASKNAADIKSAKNREILYDSLQMAHKCILNSFYGYVMRRGARWHSMEMAGIVCYTGANIIMKAREIIEQIGRPLELDTDGIWCILPSSFPENFEVHTRVANKSKLQISYANAVLNLMVNDNFTNDQYHTFTDPKKSEYKVHSENSIFFEVDGPYLAMVLPASKEEGKRLKKRYAVFNFDGSLAELKGFEVKRRGELQLIKIFQSSVFEAFLKGDTLETCYASVAKVANYWLDVLYSSGRNMPDPELFDLISENRSMSRKLEDYGTQKSTSISTAKRLAEFLGDEMVKDKGLACRFIISKYPEGTPVTDRAIPLAIFQTEDAVKKHFLRKWLKDAALASFDLRDILDWGYYIERLGGAIQKIITIPAAMQGVPNPVPRVQHPNWLHKRVLEKKDVLKQRKINEIFSVLPAQSSSDEDEINEAVPEAPDIEDFGTKTSTTCGQPVATTVKRKRNAEEDDDAVLKKSWREQLGPPPPLPTTEETVQTWLAYQKEKWALQAQQRGLTHRQHKRTRQVETNNAATGVIRSGNLTTLTGFLTRAQRTLINTPWQIIQLANTNQPGEFKAWVLVEHKLHTVKLNIPRIFYANLCLPKQEEQGPLYKRVNKVLPRARPVYNLYKYVVPERLYLDHGEKIYVDLSDPMVEGVYETQVPLLFRALVELGCVCSVDRNTKLQKDTDTFSLEQLSFLTIAKQPYLSKSDGCTLHHIYLYHHKAVSGPREMYGLFLTPVRRALIIVVDSVRTNLMPNMTTLYTAERLVKLEDEEDAEFLPPSDIAFEIRVETDLKQVYRFIQRALQGYRDEKKGPTMIAIQCDIDQSVLQASMPELADFPQVKMHIQDIDALYNSMEWQRTGAKVMIRHYLNVEKILDVMTEQCRYFHIPVGNMPADPAIFGADLFYARHLQRNNFVLWCSNSDKPDLGGVEKTDARLVAEFQECSNEICNNPAVYMSVCVELDVDSLAVNTLLQSHHVHDIEGAESGHTFDAAPLVTIEGLMSNAPTYPSYDDTVTCAEAFRVLKHTVSIWLRDVSNHRNMFSDFQIVHFYRWIRSSKALLHDPALLKTLQILMKKLYMQLVAEFKRLGSIIVYANFNKIIVCTKKTKVKDAIGYVEFVVKSIRNKELFHSIQITYNQCWDYLQWLDLANHGGIKGTLPPGLGGVGESQLGDTQTGATQEETDLQEPIVTMNWNLMEYLPEELDCRENFRLAIAGYISTVYLYSKTEEPEVNPALYINDTLEAASILGVGARLSTARFAQKLIKDDMAQKLFEITLHIRDKIPEYPTPPLAGGIPGTKVRPALEFAKSVCHVLGLDPAVEDVVREIRRHLLRVVGVGEFSDISVWTSPSLSYILPSVICKVCNHCRDIDLGRDSHHTADDYGTHWFCPLCKAHYDNLEIECALLDVVTKKMVAYNLQDLQCLKCAQIKLENIAKYCSCAGEFKTLISKTDLIKLLNNFQKLANCFGMETLLETIDSIFKYFN